MLKKCTLKSEPRNTKIIKMFSKQSKRTQRKYTTVKNYLNVLEILKKHGILWKIWLKNEKIKSTNLLHKITINKADVYNKLEIANAFNDFFTNNGQKLASKISKSSKIFETYINKVNVIIYSKSLSINNLKDSFFSLKINK